MAVTKELFGKTTNGQEISRYYISNSKGMKAGVINYGAILVNLFVPDKDGNMADVVLGYDTLEPYFTNGSFLGATVGPNANRIGGASFELNGQKYQLDVNDGSNNLHSHMDYGYHKCVWEAVEQEDGVMFVLEDADGNMGFPGNKKISVTYTVTENNELKIHYQGSSDKDTILNMTNHTYFNLNGHDAGTILNHELMIKASGYTPVIDDKAIPTGEVATVEGTPFDFRVEKPIGRDIEEEFDQLIFGQGYDHNFALDKETDGVEKIATAYSADSGITMEVYTDCVGVQLYTGNFLEGDLGKAGHHYERRAGFCLETQFFPNSINEPNFLRPVTEAGEKYQTQTIYKFDTK